MPFVLSILGKIVCSTLDLSVIIIFIKVLFYCSVTFLSGTVELILSLLIRLIS